jgi:hypothetical protein
MKRWEYDLKKEGSEGRADPMIISGPPRGASRGPSRETTQGDRVHIEYKHKGEVTGSDDVPTRLILAWLQRLIDDEPEKNDWKRHACTASVCPTCRPNVHPSIDKRIEDAIARTSSTAKPAHVRREWLLPLCKLNGFPCVHLSHDILSVPHTVTIQGPTESYDRVFVVDRRRLEDATDRQIVQGERFCIHFLA